MGSRTVTIVDHGLGNLFSVARALAALGATSRISADPKDLETAELLILPGVGSFADGMKGLEDRGLTPALKTYAASGRPFLGICLGMQLLFSEGEEFGVHPGLGIVPGRVVPIPSPAPDAHAYKLPHVGWNRLQPPCRASAENLWEESVLAGLPPGASMYFVHSYAPCPEDPTDWLAETEYGGHRFCSAVRRGRLFGCQFHPERSGPSGLHVLRNFIGMASPSAGC